MRLARGILAVVTFVYCARSGAQSAAPSDAAKAVPVNTSTVLSVPPGESLVLELHSPLDSKTARKGDRADFSTTSEVLVGDRVAIPRGTTVHATVTEAKRARAMRKARLQLQFNEIVFADGSRKPLSADLMRSGFLQARGERSKAQMARKVAINAAPGAIIGGIFGGASGAAQGAAIGAAVGIVGAMIQHGPDVDLPPGMQFEIELKKSLDVPTSALPHAAMAVSAPPPAPVAGPVPTEDPKSVAPAPSPSGPLPAASPGPSPESKPVTVAADRTLPPVPGASVSPAVRAPANVGAPAGYMLKVDVNLVLVEATVRDEHGRVIDDLKRENFRLFEDSVEQRVSYFSRDELPLAVALVVDRSGSMGPVLRQLRDAATDTLSQLKPNDQVALFAFASKSERLEGLTTDRQRIADDIAGIYTGGSTNITDALFDAALYLGRAAPNRRHVVILVSDNDGTLQGYSSEKDVIRMALETETTVYSIKVKAGGPSRALSLPLALPNALPGTGSVPKIARETGGEVIDIHTTGSVQEAMATVIARLKQRYTLGYTSTNRRRDGSFRKIDIRVAGGATSTAQKCAVYARPGYYAPSEHVAAQAEHPATSPK